MFIYTISSSEKEFIVSFSLSKNLCVTCIYITKLGVILSSSFFQMAYTFYNLKLPLDYEKSWFEDIENGEINLDREMLIPDSTGRGTGRFGVSGRFSRKMSAFDVSLSDRAKLQNQLALTKTEPIFYMSETEGLLDPGSMFDFTCRPNVSILPPEPRLSKLTGYSWRMQRYLMHQYDDKTDTVGSIGGNAFSHGVVGGGGSVEQWWPWLYEVVTHQWCSLLRAFHNPKGDSHANSVGDPSSPGTSLMY